MASWLVLRPLASQCCVGPYPDQPHVPLYDRLETSMTRLHSFSPLPGSRSRKRTSSLSFSMPSTTHCSFASDSESSGAVRAACALSRFSSRLLSAAALRRDNVRRNAAHTSLQVRSYRTLLLDLSLYKRAFLTERGELALESSDGSLELLLLLLLPVENCAHPSCHCAPLKTKTWSDL